LLGKIMGTFPSYKPTEGIVRWRRSVFTLYASADYDVSRPWDKRNIVGEGFSYVNSTFLLSLLIYICADIFVDII
jgi:hypothetical protein